MTQLGYQISFSDADNVSALGRLALWAQFLKGLRFRDELIHWALTSASIQSRLRSLFTRGAICHQCALWSQSFLPHEHVAYRQGCRSNL